jgi:hypothetical protein
MMRNLRMQEPAAFYRIGAEIATGEMIRLKRRPFFGSFDKKSVEDGYVLIYSNFMRHVAKARNGGDLE